MNSPRLVTISRYYGCLLLTSKAFRIGAFQGILMHVSSKKNLSSRGVFSHAVAVIAAFLLASSFVLAAPSSPAPVPSAPTSQKYSVTGWDTERGLPSNAVLDILQASDGYLWIASYQGLIRFDGASFKMFTPDDIPGLVRGSFWAVVENPKGTLWAATESDGLLRYRDGQWKVFKTGDGLKNDKTTYLITDGGDGLWLGSRRGVVHVQGDHIHQIPALDGGEPNVTALAYSDGALWIGTAGAGMLRYKDSQYKKYTVADGLPDDRITGLYTTRDGTLLIGAYGQGIMRLRGGKFTRFAFNGPNPPTRVNRFFEDDDGTIWVAAENGFYRVKGDQVEELKQPSGKNFVQLGSVQKDKEGNLWIGSRQTGLFLVREPSFQALSPAKGIENELVYSIEDDGAGGMWAATLYGLVHYTPHGSTVVSGWNTDKGQDLTRDVLRDRNGDIWAATNGGLVQLHNGHPRLYNVKDGMPDDRCRVLLQDATGDLWIGTFNGLARMHDGEFESFGLANGLPDNYILSLYLDSHNDVWVGTQSEGMFRFDGNRFQRGPALLSNEPAFRMIEADNTIWAGTARGLVMWRGNTIHRFTMKDGLPGNAIFQPIDDHLGNLWLTGPWGVARVPKSSLEDVAAGREHSVIVKLFGRRDGMSSREVSSVSKSMLGSDGRLYFATPSGISVVDSKRVQPNSTAPRVYIEQVIGDDREYDRFSTIDMPSGTRHLEFHFAAPTFNSPESTHFRYRLLGFDTDWVESNNRRSAYYTNLGPGKYTFQVMARNEDGRWSETAAQTNFTIAAHFWQTRWFLAFCVLVIAGLSLAAHRIRVKAVEFALRHQWLENLSMNDELTGLRNRRGLMLLAEQQVRVSERTRQPFDLIFIDLDGMKKINDEYGHHEGDNALRDTAALLRSTFRDSDIICRYGGDEFAAIVIDDSLRPSDRNGGVHPPSERLATALDEFNYTQDRRYKLSLSTGVAHYDPANPISLEELLETADKGMYRAKRAARQ
jgi:diguanylate cyclase (GGDEF)-like protein